MIFKHFAFIFIGKRSFRRLVKSEKALGLSRPSGQFSLQASTDAGVGLRDIKKSGARRRQRAPEHAFYLLWLWKMQLIMKNKLLTLFIVLILFFFFNGQFSVVSWVPEHRQLTTVKLLR